MGFTDHDRSLSFDDIVFEASTGLDATALQSGSGLSVDNSQVLGALNHLEITEADIRAGKYDRAEVDHWLVDWEKPELRVHLFRGSLGEIRRSDSAFEVELRGLAEVLNVPVGRSLLRTCDRVLGDAKCGFSLSYPGFSVEGEAAMGSGGSRLFADGIGSFDAGWFSHGSINWLSGNNEGCVSPIKSDSTVGNRRVLEFWEEPPNAINVGDRFRAFAGCDKTFETCRLKFDNSLNFRGFPHIPGEDWVLAYPKEGVVHDGTSLKRS